MTGQTEGQNTDPRCPSCGSQAVYKYGKTAGRHQRYICVMCNRQFIPGRQRRYPATRPDCPTCGEKTYVFKRGSEGVVVFRCSRYPVCRTYVSMKVGDKATLNETMP